MFPRVVSAVIALAALTSATAEASERTTLSAGLGEDRGALTYQRFGAGRAGAVSVAVETGYGTRETRNFAHPGLEQGVSVALHPAKNLAVELFAGRLSERDAQQVSAEVRYRAAEASRLGAAIDLGLGITRDYRGDTIPRLRVAASREEGRSAWSASGNFEIPVGNPERDELDVMLALGASYRAAQRLRLGAELAGEDLEGLFDDEEAEGGAKLLAGPSMRYDLPSDLYLQANLSAVYAVASDNPAAPPVGETWGLSTRAVLGWELP